jgi:hypothetical protein
MRGRALQAGYAVYYEAEAGVEHSHRYSARQQFSRSFDLGVSQADHPEIFGGIRSESEGWKYVRRMTAMLRSRGASMEIPGFYAGCAARLCGYRLGRHYRRLPRTLIPALDNERKLLERYGQNSTINGTAGRQGLRRRCRTAAGRRKDYVRNRRIYRQIGSGGDHSGRARKAGVPRI